MEFEEVLCTARQCPELGLDLKLVKVDDVKEYHANRLDFRNLAWVDIDEAVEEIVKKIFVRNSIMVLLPGDTVAVEIIFNNMEYENDIGCIGRLYFDDVKKLELQILLENIYRNAKVLGGYVL